MSATKILHTSDWHLGKKLFKTQRYPEQEAFLSWLTTEIEIKEIDLLIIAGDIFDVPSPPTYAQKIFFDFIYSLKKFPRLSTVIIGGNHDSSSLLKVPEHFFKEINCHIHTGLNEHNSYHNIYLKKNDLNIGIKTLPYFRNFELASRLSDITEENKDQKIKDFFYSFFNTWEQDVDKKILVSHHGFGEYSMAGSEHAIYLSGIEYFPLDWVKPYFDYTALGHIHKRQTLSQDPPIIYPGSPIPMRFSESNQKFVSYAELSKEKTIQNYIEIPSFRELISLATNAQDYKKEIDKLIKNQKHELASFLEIRMQLDAPTSGLADEIRNLLKNENIELLSYTPIQKIEAVKQQTQNELAKLGLTDLFKNYYSVKYPDQEIPSEILASFNELIQEIRDEDS